MATLNVHRPQAGDRPALLAGGNLRSRWPTATPRATYIAAMPAESDVGRRLDALIVRTVPGVQGGQMELALLRGRGPGWFLNFHCSRST
jgi:hypothetical protein